MGWFLTRNFVKQHLGGLEYKINNDVETCLKLKLNKDRWYLRLHDMMWENQMLKHQLQEDVKMASNLRQAKNLNPLEITTKKTILLVDDNEIFK